MLQGLIFTCSKWLHVLQMRRGDFYLGEECHLCSGGKVVTETGITWWNNPQLCVCASPLTVTQWQSLSLEPFNQCVLNTSKCLMINAYMLHHSYSAPFIIYPISMNMFFIFLFKGIVYQKKKILQFCQTCMTFFLLWYMKRGVCQCCRHNI